MDDGAQRQQRIIALVPMVLQFMMLVCWYDRGVEKSFGVGVALELMGLADLLVGMVHCMISNHAFDLKPNRRATLTPCVSRSLAGGGSDRRGVHGNDDERNAWKKTREKAGRGMAAIRAI